MSGIVYKVSRDSSSLRVDGVYRGEAIAMYDGDSNGAAAAIAILLLGVSSYQKSIPNSTHAVKDISGSEGSGFGAAVGILALIFLIAICILYTSLPVIVSAIILACCIILAISHRKFSLSLSNILLGTLYGVLVWISTILLWDATTVIPGIIDASSMSRLSGSMWPSIRISLIFYILTGIISFCDEKLKSIAKSIGKVLLAISLIIIAIVIFDIMRYL